MQGSPMHGFTQMHISERGARQSMQHIRSNSALGDTCARVMAVWADAIRNRDPSMARRMAKLSWRLAHLLAGVDIDTASQTTAVSAATSRAVQDRNAAESEFRHAQAHTHDAART